MDACFVGCVLPPSQFRAGDTERRPGRNDFTDEDIRALDLTGLPVNWEHEDDKTLGVVEQNYTTESGAKYVVVRMAADTPFGHMALHDIREGKTSEMSLEHMFLNGTLTDGKTLERRLPLSIGVTKKGNRPGCHIFPKSVWTEKPSDRFRKTIYCSVHKNSKQTAEGQTMADTTMEPTPAEGAPPQEPPAPAADSAESQAPAKPAVPGANDESLLSNLADPNNIKAYDLKSLDEIVGLTALAAQRGQKLEQALAERDSELAKMRAETEQLRKEVATAKQAGPQQGALAEKMYEDRMNELFEAMKAAGHPLPENTRDVFKLSRSGDPATMLENNQMSQVVLANSAIKMAQQIQFMQAQDERERAKASSQKQVAQSAFGMLSDRFKQENDALSNAQAFHSDESRKRSQPEHPEDTRGGKQARADMASAPMTTPAASAPSVPGAPKLSAQTIAMLRQLPDHLKDQIPEFARGI